MAGVGKDAAIEMFYILKVFNKQQLIRIRAVSLSNLGGDHGGKSKTHKYRVNYHCHIALHSKYMS